MSVVLTYVPLVALAVALVSLFLSRRAAKRTSAENQELLAKNRELSTELQNLRETKYIGTYPSYFDHVIKLINDAKESIQIVTPLLATGYLTNPKKWVHYESALLSKRANGADVKFTVYDKSRRAEYIIEKFGDEYEIDRSGQLVKLIKTGKGNFTSIQRTIEEVHKDTLRSTFKQFSITSTNKPITLYTWIIDAQQEPEAIFVITSAINDNNQEVAFHTKDKDLISALINISGRLVVKTEENRIRPLYSSVYEGDEVIKQTAIEFLEESKEVYALGTIDAVDNIGGTPYLKATRRFINGDGNVYFRIANFGLSSNKDSERQKLLWNVNFFLNLINLGSKNLNIYHNPEIAKGVDDFHFRINQNKVVVRIGGKSALKKYAVVIPDQKVRSNFIDYYNSLKASEKSRKLGKIELRQLQQILSNSKITTEELRIQLNEYLENRSTRQPFYSNLKTSNFFVSISDLTDLTASELYNFKEVFNRFGFAVLKLPPDILSKYYGDKGRELLDHDMESLDRLFGTPYKHERSKRFRVDIKLGNPPNGAFMGTTSEAYPPHTDGVYDEVPPKIMTLFCYQPTHDGGGATTLVSGKGLYEFIKDELSDYKDQFFRFQFTFERGGRMAKHPIFSKADKSENLNLTYRHDREVQMKTTNNDAFADAFRLIQSFVNDPKNILEISLDKGEILIVDNSALLHGRKEFYDPSRWLFRYSFLGDKEGSKFIYGVPRENIK